MSEVLRDLVVSLSLDGDNFSRNLASINKQIQEAESEFKRAASGVDNFEKSVKGTQSQLSTLQQKFSLQQKAVVQYQKALEAANRKLENAYTRQSKLTDSLEKARQVNDELKNKVAAAAKQVAAFERELGESNSATIAAKANLDALSNEYEQSSAEVKKLEGQLAANTKSLQNNADAVTKARTNLNQAEAALKQTEAQINSTTARLTRMQSAWTKAGDTLTAFGRKCASVSDTMARTGRNMTAFLTTPILALGTAAFKASMDYESAFASVRKTVDATEAEYQQLSDSVKQMSTEIATSSSTIAEVMANAGQLGIQKDYLVDFTRTMIDLGNSTDIAAGEAATAIAQFANVTRMAQTDFGRFGSALVDLGNNFATTESAIMNMATRLAAAGSQVGLSQAQILGFATALTSVGLEAEAGGTAFSKAMIQMQVAVETGNNSLKDFARVAGLTADEFKALWKTNPAGAIEKFIVGLSKMDEQGISSIVTLQEMGFTEVRLRDTLLRATNATELFSKAQATANEAWEDNVALTNEASKRYATTESKLKNLKNTAVLAAQRIGDDLNPTIQRLIDGAKDLLEKFMALDEEQRLMVIKLAAIAAAAGPAVLAFSKIVKVVGTVSTGFGKFATSVATAGGGWKGLLSVLSKSPAVWLAVGAAVVTATIALADYVSGAKKVREANEGMKKTAEEWKNTAAETFYGNSKGLAAFGLSKADFTRTTQSAREWLEGLLTVWTDGQKETDEIVSEWTNSFKNLTFSTREELKEMQATAQQAGYTSVAKQLTADIAQLDAMDAEIERLLKKRQSKLFSESDKIKLQELIDTREAIEVKYNLSPADTGGFEEIAQKVQAEIARAQARGKADADITVYENAMVAAAEGMAAVNAQLDAQYDKEYALIQLISDSTEKQAALDALNAKYNADRQNAAIDYAQTMASVVMPVWQQADIQQAATDVEALTQKLREYSAAAETEKPALLEDLNAITAAMDEGALTEYVTMLTQIQSLLDSGMSESEIQAMFPEIDFTTALNQIASIQAFLSNRELELPGLNEMFGEALPEEVLKIATDLDMTGAQERWNEFAQNPGAITTEAIISEIKENEETVKLQPKVEAFIAKYTEVPEGADKTELTPEGLIAVVSAYAEATTGADVSGLTPENVTAMVSAYKELDAGADLSQLQPDEITAYISSYAQTQGIDLSGISPDGLTAFVLAYEEVTGGALTTALTPDNITAMVTKYLEADNVDISALSAAQIEAIVTSFAEATGCDKSQLLQNFTAYIAKYDDSNAVKPKLSMTVGIYGYDLIAYRKFVAENPVEVKGIVKLGEVYENPADALLDPQTKFWQDGQQIPVDVVPTELLTPDKVAVLDEDGTLHVLVAPDVTGAEEAIAGLRREVAEIDQFGTTTLGKALGFMPTTTLDLIDSALARIETAKGRMGKWWNFIFGGDSGLQNTLDTSMKLDFSAERVAELSTYVAEVVAAISQGKEVKQEDMENLQKILTFLQELDTNEVGTHVLEGVGEGMTAAGWDSDAETVAANLEAALNAALQIQSPSQRVKPVGENVSAGVGEGISGYDFTTDAATLASGIEAAVTAALPQDALASLGIAAAQGLADAMTGYSMSSTGSAIASGVRTAVFTNLTSSTLRSAGINAMAGLTAGINAGRSGVISAMRSAARAAVSAAKSELKIKSPSQVFEDEVGVMTMRGFGKGVLKETKEQARVIRNASRYLTGEAKDGSIATMSNDNRRTYNNSVNSTIQVQQMIVRDEQDIRALAVEIATLTRRQQRGKGLRFA